MGRVRKVRNKTKKMWRFLDTPILSVRIGSEVGIQRIMDVESFKVSVRHATLSEE